jgi:hypothetical protein
MVLLLTGFGKNKRSREWAFFVSQNKGGDGLQK